MKIALTVFTALLLSFSSFAQTNWFEGTWQEAFAEAQQQNKYLFVDAYTDWCVWCKVADEKTFPKEAVADLLNQEFIAVKVDMERGDGVALGAKYRVMGYPSYLMFTPKGEFAQKMTGFTEDPAEFAEQVKNSLDASKHPKYPSLLTDKVDFPDFYVNSFTNKDKDTKRKNPEEGVVDKWLTEQKDLKSEAAWSVIYRFPNDESFTQKFLEERNSYAEKFGSVEVDEKISGIAFNMLQKAMKSHDEADLQEVMEFADKYIEEKTEERKSVYKLKFCEGKGDWTGYVDCVNKLIDFYGFENFLIDLNNYSWTIYLNADNPDVVKISIGWMAKVVELDPQYMYLDTYAALLFKSGDNDMALTWADKAIAAGKENGDDVKETEELRTKILEAKGSK